MSSSGRKCQKSLKGSINSSCFPPWGQMLRRFNLFLSSRLSCLQSQPLLPPHPHPHNANTSASAAAGGNPYRTTRPQPSCSASPTSAPCAHSQPAPPGAPSDLNPFRWGLPEWAAGPAPLHTDSGRAGQGTLNLDPREPEACGPALTSFRKAKLGGGGGGGRQHAVVQACNTPCKFMGITFSWRLAWATT